MLENVDACCYVLDLGPWIQSSLQKIEAQHRRRKDQLKKINNFFFFFQNEAQTAKQQYAYELIRNAH